MFEFKDFPTLQTERLILREIVPGDADAVFRIRGDFEVTRYNVGAAYTRIEQAQGLIDGIHHDYVREQEIRWGITRKEDGSDAPVIGMCGYNYWHRVDRRGSIGFDLARDYWRQGLMQETVETVLRFGFTEMDLNRIEAEASSDNEASIHLLEKLGFQREGLQREHYFEEGAFHDLALYSLLRREWETTKEGSENEN